MNIDIDITIDINTPVELLLYCNVAILFIDININVSINARGRELLYCKYLPISPRFSPTIIYRSASSAVLHLVNRWYSSVLYCTVL